MHDNTMTIEFRINNHKIGVVCSSGGGMYAIHEVDQNYHNAEMQSGSMVEIQSYVYEHYEHTLFDADFENI